MSFPNEFIENHLARNVEIRLTDHQTNLLRNGSESDKLSVRKWYRYEATAFPGKSVEILDSDGYTADIVIIDISGRAFPHSS